MSQQLISHSEDLKQLQIEGYDIEIRAGKFLLIKDVPYVDSTKEIKVGILVLELALAGDKTAPPANHVAYFIGEHPCHTSGSIIAEMKHTSVSTTHTAGLVSNHSFSAKPKPDGKYRDFHHKAETYVGIISAPAQTLNPKVTARTFGVTELTEAESPFKYTDTASSRAGIEALNDKFKGQKIAIIGVGGTGSYILDLVAKTCVDEIHIYDSDEFINHNAFRSPGAPSIDILRSRISKATYFGNIYSYMRHKLFAHDHLVSEENLEELAESTFVFLCIDNGAAKQPVIEFLLEKQIPFIDVGVGVNINADRLLGQIRTTLVLPGNREHAFQNVSVADLEGENEYSRNIQIAELNALNAALAVVKWKKTLGFYLDLELEENSVYQIDGNTLINSGPNHAA